MSRSKPGPEHRALLLPGKGHTHLKLSGTGLERLRTGPQLLSPSEGHPDWAKDGSRPSDSLWISDWQRTGTKPHCFAVTAVSCEFLCQLVVCSPRSHDRAGTTESLLLHRTWLSRSAEQLSCAGSRAPSWPWTLLTYRACTSKRPLSSWPQPLDRCKVQRLCISPILVLHLDHSLSEHASRLVLGIWPINDIAAAGRGARQHEALLEVPSAQEPAC